MLGWVCFVGYIVFILCYSLFAADYLNWILADWILGFAWDLNWVDGYFVFVFNLGTGFVLIVFFWLLVDCLGALRLVRLLCCMQVVGSGFCWIVFCWFEFCLIVILLIYLNVVGNLILWLRCGISGLELFWWGFCVFILAFWFKLIIIHLYCVVCFAVCFCFLDLSFILDLGILSIFGYADT